MRPRNDPDRITVAFDDHRLVANAGLILPATLARHLGLPPLVDRHLDLRDAPGPGQHRRQDDDPVWQEQVVQLIMDVAGMTAAQADEIRRAFARPNNSHLIALHRQRFLEGAMGKGVPEETAERIFAKINGQYMFPESHSHAFAVTAYQAAWLQAAPSPWSSSFP